MHHLFTVKLKRISLINDDNTNRNLPIMQYICIHTYIYIEIQVWELILSNVIIYCTGVAGLNGSGSMQNSSAEDEIFEF